MIAICILDIFCNGMLLCTSTQDPGVEYVQNTTTKFLIEEPLCTRHTIKRFTSSRFICTTNTTSLSIVLVFLILASSHCDLLKGTSYISLLNLWLIFQVDSVLILNSQMRKVNTLLSLLLWQAIWPKLLSEKCFSLVQSLDRACHGRGVWQEAWLQLCGRNVRHPRVRKQMKVVSLSAWLTLFFLFHAAFWSVEVLPTFRASLLSFVKHPQEHLKDMHALYPLWTRDPEHRC